MKIFNVISKKPEIGNILEICSTEANAITDSAHRPSRNVGTGFSSFAAVGNIAASGESNSRCAAPTPIYSKVTPTFALIVSSQSLEDILNGSKSWEMQIRPTKMRGPVGLIAKGSQFIVGMADIVGVAGPIDVSTLEAIIFKDQISVARHFESGMSNRKFAWALSNTKSFRAPVSHTHRNSAVRFVRMTKDEVIAVMCQM